MSGLPWKNPPAAACGFLKGIHGNHGMGTQINKNDIFRNSAAKANYDIFLKHIFHVYASDIRTDGRTDGRAGGRAGGRTDGWAGGRTLSNTRA